jgi:hypothetical protein
VQRTVTKAQSSRQRRQRLLHSHASGPSPIAQLADINQQAAPVSLNARDPGKVSHHIHRIGYHFRSEIVETACENLGYFPYQGAFITGEDLKQKQHNSVVAQAFAKMGLNYDRVQGNEESPEQVRAAIKELFPKIPQLDLDAIVTHAWAKNSKRVGSAVDIPLPRRVQLAVIARIRHTYTDYDALLGAFGDWKGTRMEVEPGCLQKLIEWRGETGDDDEALEEIVRETIVIDDDDDDAPFAGRGDDSSDTGDVSDTSIEISHRPAVAEDLRAEHASERDHRYFQRRIPERVQAQRNDIARQKIQTYRSREQNARAYAHNQPAAYQHTPAGTPQRIYVPAHDNAEPPRQVIVGGQVLRLVSQDSTSRRFDRLITIQVREEAPQQYVGPAPAYPQHDRPMQSIERDDRPPAYQSQPTTPQAARPMQHQHHYVDLTQDSPGHAPLQHEIPHHQYERRQTFPQAHHRGDVIDLTSPRRPHDERPVAQPQVIRVISSGDGRYVQAPVDHDGYARAQASMPGAWPVEAAPLHGRYYDANAAEYNPNRPLIEVRERGVYNTAPSSRYASPAQPGWPQAQREQIPSEHLHRPGPEQPMVQYTYPAAAPYPAPVSRSVPVPVHGAPAPVQQMPRELAQQRHTPTTRYDLAAADPNRQPVYLAPQNAQYYPR